MRLARIKLTSLQQQKNINTLIYVRFTRDYYYYVIKRGDIGFVFRAESEAPVEAHIESLQEDARGCLILLNRGIFIYFIHSFEFLNLHQFVYLTREEHAANGPYRCEIRVFECRRSQCVQRRFSTYAYFEFAAV